MIAYTDYPFEFLGDTPNWCGPIREIEVLSYDRNKYCRIIVEGWYAEIKRGYIYQQPGRLLEVDQVSEEDLGKLPNHLDYL